MKTTLILVCCLLAFTQAAYVLQRLYARDDTKCEGNFYPFGTFYQQDTCSEPAPGYTQIFSCNSTHATQRVGCNNDCSNCQFSTPFKLKTCVDMNYARMIYECVETLPEIEKTGIYMRQFQNEECKRQGGDFGLYFPKENCGRASSPQGSVYVGYDGIKQVFKQIEYDKSDCQGNVVRGMEFKLDVCLRTPTQFAKLMSKQQPAPFVKFSKK